MSRRDSMSDIPVEADLSACRRRGDARQDHKITEMVKEAIKRHDLALAFQPVVQSSRPGSVAFYEGLIRILDPKGKPIPAADFINAIETTDLGRRIDCLALEMGLIALTKDPGMRLAINMSARSIGYPDWMETLNRGLQDDDTVAERLILEITESSAMLMPELVAGFMRNLQARGVSFALDDFGAGYTSFRYLREFYFDILKIDGQFIKEISRNPDNQVLTQALISVARHFGMFTIAEAVESGEDAAFLAELGVDCLQGYYFGAPTILPPWETPSEEISA